MRFLLQVTLSRSYTDFVLEELTVLCQLYGIAPEEVLSREEVTTTLQSSCFLIVNLPSVDVARSIFKRAVLVKGVYLFLSSGRSYEELIESLKVSDAVTSRAFSGPDQSWCCEVECFGHSLSVEEKEARRLLIAPIMGFQGPVRLKPPTNEFYILEDYGAIDCVDRSKLPLQHVYFGLFVSEGARRLVGKLDLKKRPYLGPTSLVPELSLLMANQAMVKPGDFVFDPFLGTGSLAIAAAEVGALVWGGDIDMRVINGKQGRNLASCFRLYGLGTPEIVRMDNSARCFREVPLFHAIICDPPYGVRAGARKSGVDPKDGAAVVGPSEEFRSISFPRTSVYEAVDVMRDLLDMAARTLLVGGRLAYLLPTTVGYSDDELPVHPCLAVVSNSEQPLSRLFSRRLVTMQKVCPYDWSKRSEYRAAAESQEALAPSYADIQKRIAEAKAALGLSSAGEPSDMMEALAGACRGDGGPAKPKRDKKQNQFKDMPPELRPVGNAPFDKPKPLTKE